MRQCIMHKADLFPSTGENMQTLHRKAPAGENLPSVTELLPAAPPVTVYDYLSIRVLIHPTNS